MATMKEKIDFILKTKRAWQKSMKKVPLAWLLPQAILESGWGQSGLARDCHNLFGMKSTHFGQGPCKSHKPPASEGATPYTNFDSMTDCLNGYMRKVTHSGNRFYPCYLAGLSRGKYAYWKCLAALGWAGASDYHERIARVDHSMQKLLAAAGISLLDEEESEK